MNKIFMIVSAAVLFAGIFAQSAVANNMKVTNVVMSAGDYSTYTIVQSDISWDHSWRAAWLETNANPEVTVTNWDAAWIFLKYRTDGVNWMHASLNITNSKHSATGPIGSTINVGLSTNAGGTNFGAGVFFYRSAEGSGSWTNKVKLRWNYKQDGLTSTTRVEVCVHAVEMVYVPQCNFYVGDGRTTIITGTFENGAFTNALQITSENQLTLGGGTDGSLGNNNTNGMQAGMGDDFNDTVTTNLPPEFPKGYNAFYCMKYEISQGQYADFLNMLTPVQAVNRFPTNNGINRFTITSNASVYAASAPDRACNWLSWADGTAYEDWAGLRPMTELEFEKACRGPVAPVVNEFAWGNGSWTAVTNFFDVDGSGTEIADPSTANCNGNNKIPGPVRCGIYATSVSGRSNAGATYWGIMEMSGDLYEMTVSVGSAAGRQFTGIHGDGMLNPDGSANCGLWPNTSATGAGTRGGSWAWSVNSFGVSYRSYANWALSGRGNAGGNVRFVRTAP